MTISSTAVLSSERSLITTAMQRGDIVIKEFVTTAGQTEYNLGQTIENERSTLVHINGIYQHKKAYSIAGSTLTLSSAPDTGSDVEVIILF